MGMEKGDKQKQKRLHHLRGLEYLLPLVPQIKQIVTTCTHSFACVCVGVYVLSPKINIQKKENVTVVHRRKNLLICGVAKPRVVVGKWVGF